MSVHQDDFAAYTTLGDRTVPVPDRPTPLHRPRPSGPSFAPPPKLQASPHLLNFPFLLLAKSARGAAAAHLVSQAVAAPGLYVFAELLDQPSIQELAAHEQYAPQYRLLELFAYGTWADYQARRDLYPTLTPEQETKLRHLTILTLASTQRSIPYSTLLSLLSVPDLPTLEDLLIAAFYANVLRGKLDAKEQRLEVLSAQGRDVRRAPLATASVAEDYDMHLLDPLNATSSSSSSSSPTPASLLAALVPFQTTLTNLLDALAAQLAQLHARAINADEHVAAHARKVREVVEGEVAERERSGRAGPGASRRDGSSAGAQSGDANEMDVDLTATGFSGGGRGVLGSEVGESLGAGGGSRGGGRSGGGGGSGSAAAAAAARARKRNRQ